MTGPERVPGWRACLRTAGIALLFCAGLLILLGGIVYFGAQGKQPTEMGIAVAAGFGLMLFSSLDRISEIALGSVQVRLRAAESRAVQASVTVDQLRDTTYALGLAVYELLAFEGVMGAMPKDTKAKLVGSINDAFERIGVSKNELVQANATSRRLAHYRHAGKVKESAVRAVWSKDAKLGAQLQDRLHEHFDFPSLTAPTAGRLRKLIDAHGQLDEATEARLREYEEAEKDEPAEQEDA